MADSTAWTRLEVEAAVADYIHMLTLELSGQSYNKSAHRRALLEKLNGRSDGSVERKHQNISAILIALNCPYISGYKPLSNYQELLFEVVADCVTKDQLFNRSAEAAVERPAIAPLTKDFSSLLVTAPVPPTEIKDSSPRYLRRAVGIRRDYLVRETQNRSLGTAGEEFVVAYERYRLFKAGEKKLSEKVEHVAVTKGDGLGYDVLSFDLGGKERLIEVKTTTFGRETPFYITRNEVELSRSVPNQFHLYRLFEFRREPRMFDLPGKVNDNCLLDPVTYLAKFS